MRFTEWQKESFLFFIFFTQNKKNRCWSMDTWPILASVWLIGVLLVLFWLFLFAFNVTVESWFNETYFPKRLKGVSLYAFEYLIFSELGFFLFHRNTDSFLYCCDFSARAIQLVKVSNISMKKQCNCRFKVFYTFM